MPSLRLMQPEEVAELRKEKNTGARKAIELFYDDLIRDYAAGQMVEVTLESDDSKVNTRNRLRAAAQRRGLDVTFHRVRDDSLLRFELCEDSAPAPSKKK